MKALGELHEHEATIFQLDDEECLFSCLLSLGSVRGYLDNVHWRAYKTKSGLQEEAGTLGAFFSGS